MGQTLESISRTSGSGYSAAFRRAANGLGSGFGEVLSSRPVSRRTKTVGLVLLALVAGWSWHLRAVEPSAPAPQLETRSATVVVAGRESEVLYAPALSAGPLFALSPLARAVGAELSGDVGGRAYTLKVGGASFLFGPDSDLLVAGQELVTLTRRPVVASAGLFVSLELLEQTLGSAGWTFTWQPDTERLQVDRAPTNQVPVTIEVVHLSGATTVVVSFPANKPRVRIANGPTWVDLQAPGSALELQAALPPGDPLVRQVDLGASSLRLRLAPGAQATHYTLEDPFRVVFDVQAGAAGVAGSPLPAAEPGVPPPANGQLRTIVLDPGHGGVETGAIGKAGTQEKELTLQLAVALKKRLEASLPARVVLTRSADEQLPLPRRTAIANENRADLFVSIHLNSSRGGNPTGAETYFLSLTASDRSAAESAARENPSGATETSEEEAALDLILWDLAQSQHLAESQRFATLVQEELNQALGLKDRGVKQAPFAVLIGATMPAVLVELGFLSNPEEEAKLKQPAYQEQLAAAVARAIERYQAGRVAAAQPPAVEAP
jgi:N-acetylmuramoyl-L-alanine amidase